MSKCSKCNQPILATDAFMGHETATWHSVCPSQPNQHEDTLQCGHTGPNWDGNGNCITCTRDRVLGSEQYEDKELSVNKDDPLELALAEALIGENPVKYSPSGWLKRERLLQLITQKQLEARKEELSYLLTRKQAASSLDFLTRGYIEQRIAELTKQEGKG